MSSEEAAHAFPIEVTPRLGKGTLDAGGFVISVVVGLRADISRRMRRNTAMGKPRKPGRTCASA
jgi:hypothetical protein